MKKKYMLIPGAICLAAAVSFSDPAALSAHAEEIRVIRYDDTRTSNIGPGAQSMTTSSEDTTVQTAAPAATAAAAQTAAPAATAAAAQTAASATTPAAQTSAQTTVTAAAASSAAESQTGITTKNGYKNGDKIGLNSAWKYADYSVIHSGSAVMYTATSNRKNRVIAVNAGHGTKGGESVKAYCHPDKTPKVTGGTTAAGAVKAIAVSSGMTFNDGTPEKVVTLRMAQILKEKLLNAGYDVLMIRDGEDVQLDNIARTVISNNTADAHIALHWDGDGLSKIKGVFYMSVPDGLKKMEPVASHWQEHERLGDALIAGLQAQGLKVWGANPLDMDLTQTSYSTIPSVDIELGNQCSDHSDHILSMEGDGLLAGINSFFGY